MNDVIQTIESLLFVSTKPLTVKKLALLTGVSMADIRNALTELTTLYTDTRGIQLQVLNDSAQLVSHPKNAELIRTFLKLDQTGELTRSAVETLSIIAYRGPISKEDIEHIRGVNCSIALRNLLIRGLIESSGDKEGGIVMYMVTFDTLRYLGLATQQDLPEYEHFHAQVFTQDPLIAHDTEKPV